MRQDRLEKVCQRRVLFGGVGGGDPAHRVHLDGDVPGRCAVDDLLRRVPCRVGAVVDEAAHHGVEAGEQVPMAGPARLEIPS